MSAGIDAKAGEAAVDGWTEGSGVAAQELAAKMAKLGYCHLVYTDIARDGMQTGFDVAAYKAMAHAFGNPVIASGGLSTVADIHACPHRPPHRGGHCRTRLVRGNFECARGGGCLRGHLGDGQPARGGETAYLGGLALDDE